MKKYLINEINAPFFAAVCGSGKKSRRAGLLVYFKNRSYGGQPFPREMFDELRADSSVDSIVDGETGELLFPEI